MMMKREILEKYFKKALPPEEEKKVEQWILDTSNKKAVLDFLESVYLTETERQEIMPFDEVFDRIRQKEKASGKVILFRQKWFWAATAACILFLLGGAWLGYYLNASGHQNTSWKINTAQTGPGQYAKITLSDGSTVFLASNTSLSFPEEAESNPVVFLDGEAYFDLENGGADYTIKTKDLITNTRNSKLNISSLPGDNLVRVMVKSGKASIKGNDGDNANSESTEADENSIEENKPTTVPLVKLIPSLKVKANEQAIFDRTTKETVIVVLDPNTPAFLKLYPARKLNHPDSTSEVISFSNSSIGEITNKLHKMYNLDFELNLDESRAKRYTGGFNKSENPFNVLIVVCQKLGLTYVVQGNMIRITELHEK